MYIYATFFVSDIFCSVVVVRFRCTIPCITYITTHRNTSSSTHNNSVQTIGGQIAIKVYLLDNSMKTLLVDLTATVYDICTYMADKCGITSISPILSSCFSLHECIDGVNISKPLPLQVPVIDVIKKWPSGNIPRFVYQIKLFVDSIKHSKDKHILRLLYIQLVYNVITGIYPVTIDEAISLAALQVQANFGSHKPTVHKAGYLKTALRGLIPGSLFERKTPEEWEAIILNRHANLTEDSQARPMVLYCAVLATREYFGCAFYGVKQKFSKVLPSPLILGISGKGIYIMDPEDKRIIERYSLGQLYRWGYDPDKSFTFQIKTPAGTPGPIFEFGTLVGHYMSNLLTDYASQILAEMSATQPVNDTVTPTSSSTSSSSSSSSSTVPPMVTTIPSSVHSSSTVTTVATTSSSTFPVSVPPPPSSSNQLSSSSSSTVISVPPPPSSSSLSTPSNASSSTVSTKSNVPKDTRTAAIKIQSWVRGYLARKMFDRMIATLEEDLRKQGKL